MKPQSLLLAVLGLAAFTCAVNAASRGSADYSIAMESLDQGGTMLASADYTVRASVNDSGVTANEATSGYLAKSGYIGQLFDVVGVIPTAPTSALNEGFTLQLGAAQVLDDATLLPFLPSLASWSVDSGPIIGIDANGLASAMTVYQDAPATVRAVYQGFTGTLALTVLNGSPDNFGSYAGDGLPDDWQVYYFGRDNPSAAPSADATGSGQTNLFKYIAGLNPADRAAVFRIAIRPVVGQPDQKQIVFGPVLSDRTYTVYYKTNLTDATWAPLTSATQSDNSQQRTVTDASAAGKTKFYRVQISKP